MSEAFGSGGSDQSGAVGLAQASADVLIAERGQEYLQELLSKTQTPHIDVPMFQRRAGLPEAECKPLLQLADKLKLRRCVWRLCRLCRLCRLLWKEGPSAACIIP